MVTINRYIKALLHPAGGHQGSHKAHQAGNQRIIQNSSENLNLCFSKSGLLFVM